jgi:hypothetical protein
MSAARCPNARSRQRWRWFSASVVAVACGSFVFVSGAVAATRSADAESWSTAYCSELTAWRAEIAKVVPRVQAAIALAEQGKVSEGQKAIAFTYRRAAKASATFVDRMDAVGQPDVVNGRKVKQLVSTTYGGIGDAFSEAADAIAKPKAKTFDDLAERGNANESELQAELDAFADSFGALATLDTSGALNAGLTAVGACIEYFG